MELLDDYIRAGIEHIGGRLHEREYGLGHFGLKDEIELQRLMTWMYPAVVRESVPLEGLIIVYEAVYGTNRVLGAKPRIGRETATIEDVSIEPPDGFILDITIYHEGNGEYRRMMEVNFFHENIAAMLSDQTQYLLQKEIHEKPINPLLAATAIIMLLKEIGELKCKSAW
ncbi:MAG: hypothetical protein AABW49_00090 [Nanoarchaeota archaeon]